MAVLASKFAAAASAVVSQSARRLTRQRGAARRPACLASGCAVSARPHAFAFNCSFSTLCAVPTAITASPRTRQIRSVATMHSLVNTTFKEVNVTVANTEKKQVETQKVPRQGRYTFLVFYPMDFTFVCPTELIALNEHLQEFKKLDCDVYGVSCDSEFCHLAWAAADRKDGGLGPDFKVPLIADRAHALSKQFHCLLESEGFPLRATILIDREGVVRASTVYEPRIGRSVVEMLRLLDACQHTDKHGEVCPIDFNKKASGKAALAMKPTHEGVKEYLSKTN